MGVIKAVAGLGAVAFAGVTFMLADGMTPHRTNDAIQDNAAGRVAERFRLVLYGADTGCEVVKGDSVSARKARLIFGAACADELPDLANARFWAEREDGSVAFTA
jgi:hypothetical protein